LENICISDDFDIIDWILDQGNPVMTKGEDASASDSDIGTNGSEHCDGNPRQLEQIDDENEFRDTTLKDLVMIEGP
jgi:hypothetical protein